MTINNNILGLNIRVARMVRGLSQKKLAEMIGCTPQNLGTYERGLAKPTLKQMEKLSGALGYPVDVLMQGQVDIRAPGESATEGSSNKKTAPIAGDELAGVVRAEVEKALSADPRLRLLDERLEDVFALAKEIRAERQKTTLAVRQEDIDSLDPPPNLSKKERERWKRNIEALRGWAQSQDAFRVPPNVLQKFCREFNQGQSQRRAEDVALALHMLLAEGKSTS